MSAQGVDNYNKLAADNHYQPLNQHFLNMLMTTLTEDVALNPEQTNKFHELSFLLNEIKTRANFFLDIPSHEEHKSWFQNSSSLYNKLKRIHLTIAALREVAATNAVNKDQAAEVVLLFLEAQLLNLKMNQLTKIAKDQDVSRQQEIKLLRNAYYNTLDKINDKLSGTDFSTEFNQITHPAFSRLLKYENRLSMNLKRHIGRLNKTSDAITAASSPYNIFSSINSAMPALINMGHLVSTFLLAIPLVGAIAISLPIVTNAIRTWTKGQSTNKKIFATAAVGIVIAGIILAGALPVAAAGIVCGLITMGVFVNNVKPWWDARKEVSKRGKEVADLEERIPKLLDQRESLALDNTEKNAILNAMENYCIHCLRNNIPLNEAKFAQAKKLLIQGDKAELMRNECINLTLQHMKIDDLNEFRVQHAIDRRVSLNDELIMLRQKEKQEFSKMLVGVGTIVGALLLCIPFPPTMIAGAAILAATQLTGLAIKYQVPQKISNFMRKLFKTEKATANEAEVATHPKSNIQLQSLQATTATVQTRVNQAPPTSPIPKAPAVPQMKVHRPQADNLTIKYNTLFVEPKKTEVPISKNDEAKVGMRLSKKKD